ncbi:sporulation integral membrane protein YtvI [Paenibacillus bouchesdurhonensis]|uniref:sporulation integral membrane protein YtvI n=1 Tax=Paenibacillus bouchesdurhonensis TaxID=1870990 RepID=UPI000DA635B6|nr:sporulation integral membrane protein YtvI [Paenibacillus bouchesdurhonensis]
MDNVLFKRALRGTWVCLLLVALLLAAYWLVPLLYPFLIAWLVAYIMNPFVSWVEDHLRLPRWLAVTFALLVYFGSMIIVFSAAITRLVKELIHVTDSLDLSIEKWKNIILEWSQNEKLQNTMGEINRFIASHPGYSNTLHKNIDSTAVNISTAISRTVASLLNGVVNLLTSLPSIGIILLVILLAAFFMSKNWNQNWLFLARLIPGPFQQTAREIWIDLRKALFGYLTTQFIMISITAVIVLIGLLILGVESAFTYAILIGFVDLLPYLGVGTIMLPWLIYAYISGDFTLGIGLSILYGIILVARQLIEPKVLATSVGLEPLPVLIAMFAGLKLFGVLGLIIGPVSLVIMGAVIRAGVVRDLRNYIMNGRLR